MSSREISVCGSRSASGSRPAKSSGARASWPARQLPSRSRFNGPRLGGRSSSGRSLSGFSHTPPGSSRSESLSSRAGPHRHSAWSTSPSGLKRSRGGSTHRSSAANASSHGWETRSTWRFVGAAFGSRASAPAEAVAWAFRLFCEALARRRPLLLVLDDLHWAEAAFLDLVESLVDRSRDAPIVVLCVAREELLERQPGFLSGRERAEMLGLERLAEEESDALSEALCSEAGLSAETRRRIAEGAEGNPLFLEQLVALAAEEGGLEVGQPLPA